MIGIALVNKIRPSVSIIFDLSATISPNEEHAMQLKSLLYEARDLAFDLLVKWNMGHCKDGIIILYSASDNILYTAVDSTAAFKLTGDLIGEISANVRMELSRNTSAGLIKLLSSIKSVIQGTYKRTTNWDSNNDALDALPVVSSAADSRQHFAKSLCVVLTLVCCCSQLVLSKSFLIFQSFFS